MKTHDWNPNSYLKFNKERVQPSIDLVARIKVEHPSKILDVGCGPGNSTQILAARWPEAEITGADNSPAMIEKASADYPRQNWILFDANNELPDEKYDVIFSNATIQWIPDHAQLIKRFSLALKSKGVLAVQIPLFFDMPLGKLIAETARKNSWKEATQGVDELFTIHQASFYYNELSKYFNSIDLWTTDYYHVMDSQEAILEMIRSTGLKPYLERITDENEKQKFENCVLEEIKREYPLQENNKVLFAFKRLFFVAKNK